MNFSDHDPFEAGFGTLRNREWSAPGHRAALKETLMNEFETVGTMSRRNRNRALAVGAGILLLGGLGFAAAKTWLVKVEVNGQVVDTREVTPDENGEANFKMTTGDGRDASVTVKSAEG